MAAYRTANRLFPGCHLPLVCMAMESQRQKNTSLAEQYLAQAHAMCPWDPLIANELGVLKYKENECVRPSPPRGHRVLLGDWGDFCCVPFP